MFASGMMSSLVLCVGRFLFFALIITQCFLLASYPATYKDNSAWYAVAITYVFSVIPWACLVLFSAAKLRRCTSLASLQASPLCLELSGTVSIRTGSLVQTFWRWHCAWHHYFCCCCWTQQRMQKSAKKWFPSCLIRWRWISSMPSKCLTLF